MDYQGRITGKIDPAWNVPVIECRVAGPDGIDSRYEGGLRVRALMDTGADHVLIRPEHVTALGLTKTGEKFCHNVGFSGDFDAYTVELAFDMANPVGRPFTFWIHDVPALCSKSFAEVSDIVLPMPELQKFAMSFLPTGEFELLYFHDIQPPER
jgi:hypothetical protein